MTIRRQDRLTEALVVSKIESQIVNSSKKFGRPKITQEPSRDVSEVLCVHKHAL